MRITNALKLALKRILSLQFGEVNTDKGRLIWDGNADLKEGDEVYVAVEGEDEPQVAPDGEYVTDDNKTIVVVEGKVAEIRDPEAEVADEPAAEEENVEANADISVEAAEEEVVEEVIPADEEETTNEISVEDRIAALEARINEFVDGINGIVNAIAALEARIAEVEGKLASVEAPAADPIDEKPETDVEQKRSRLSYMRKD